MNNQKYILEGKKLKPVDLMTWAKWFGTADRHIARDEISGVTISTVFLGIDHNWGDGPPLLFETMIFGGEHDGYQHRYETWDQASNGHQKVLKLVKDER